jgi:hypothetical protein
MRVLKKCLVSEHIMHALRTLTHCRRLLILFFFPLLLPLFFALPCIALPPPVCANTHAHTHAHARTCVCCEPLGYAVGYSGEWEEWMGQIEPYAARAPVMVQVGNHERNWNRHAHKRQQQLPRAREHVVAGGRVDPFLFDWGSLFFVMALRLGPFSKA